MAVPRYLHVALDEIGVYEVPGDEDHPRIVEYHGAAGLEAPDEVSWCSAFVCWVMARCSLVGTGNKAARSWMKWGQPTDTPSVGDVVVFWRESKSSWKGHVGFYMGRTKGGNVICLGGNQSNGVTITNYPADRVLGYRRIQV